jgi:hypothetical protein
MLFRRKNILVEASQWFTNGDHPLDNCETCFDSNGQPFPGEGKVVQYYRHPLDSGDRVCVRCLKLMHVHGWIDQGKGHTVCPGDWIVTEEPGTYRPYSQTMFAYTFEVA